MEAPLSPTHMSQLGFYGGEELDDLLNWDPIDAGLFVDAMTEGMHLDALVPDGLMPGSPSHSNDDRTSSEQPTSPEHYSVTIKTESGEQEAMEFAPYIEPVVEGVPYPQVATLRARQRAQGWNLDSLNQAQLGLEYLDRCHHVTMNQTIKGGPLSHRVRVCKRCCGEDSHIELGTYLDQESAILVNDAHELLQGRYAKLLVLTPQDIPFLHMFSARRYNRGKIEVKGVLDILKERELEREQRRVTSNGPISSTLKRRRTNYEEEPSTIVALTSTPEDPLTIAAFDKDMLISKLSPVLDLMASHAAFTFNKFDPATFHQRFRYVFSKAISPVPGDEHEPFETILATTASVLLSAYGDSTDTDIRYLLDALAQTYPVAENSELYAKVLEFMEDVNDGAAVPELYLVNQAVNNYLTEVKALMWKYLQDSKCPRRSKDDSSPCSEAMEAHTCELIGISERKRHVLSRLRNFLVELPAHYDPSHPALETTQQMLKSCSMYLAWYTVGITSFRLRQIDLTNNFEHAEVALDVLGQLQPFFDDLGSLEKFHVLVHTLAVYNRLYSKRRARGTPPSAPSPAVQYVFDQLLSVARELGFLPITEESKMKNYDTMGELHLIAEKVGSHPLPVYENKALLYGYIFEYAFLHSDHVIWPDGLTFNALSAELKATLRRVQEDAMTRGIIFVLPYAWRALFMAMETCAQACFKSAKCLSCAHSLSQMCYTVLVEGGKRFGHAQFYAFKAEGIMKQIHKLQIQETNLV